MNGSIGQRCAHGGFDDELGEILEEYHHEEVVGGNHSGKGDKHKGEGIEDIGQGRAAYGAYPEPSAIGEALDTVHEPGIGELAKEEAHQRGNDDAGYIGKDMIVGCGGLGQIVGRGQPYSNGGADHHDNIAQECKPDDAARNAVAPYFGEYIAQHVGKGEGDCAGVKIEEAEDADDLYGHNVGHEIEGHEECRNDHERSMAEFPVFERVFRYLIHK